YRPACFHLQPHGTPLGLVQRRGFAPALAPALRRAAQPVHAIASGHVWPPRTAHSWAARSPGSSIARVAYGGAGGASHDERKFQHALGIIGNLVSRSITREKEDGSDGDSSEEPPGDEPPQRRMPPSRSIKFFIGPNSAQRNVKGEAISLP